MNGERPLRTSDFDYQLPPELIAQHPLPDRGSSRLLVVGRDHPSPERGANGGGVRDAIFAELPHLIPSGDLLVLNTTRVRHARLLGRRPSGAPAEVLLLHPGPGETWVAMGQPGSALRPGKRIELDSGIWIQVEDMLPEGYRTVRMVGASADTVIRRYGRLPLPPYITREPGVADETAYQTVFADREGSVAAPTAGLHFTPALLAALEAGGVELGRLDLEVGPGTFRPVEEADPSRHSMHAELFEIPARLAAQVRGARSRGGAVWAVGTTVVRALESAGHGNGEVRIGKGETSLLITPGYRFQVVDHLLTNFHLPRSTLLMLVCAFAGYETTMAAYRHGIAQRYRFYSYGDAMLIV